MSIACSAYVKKWLLGQQCQDSILMSTKADHTLSCKPEGLKKLRTHTADGGI